jgi:Ni,Fe-hydrogenase III small subunit
MSQWVLKGIRTGIKTSRYPAEVEQAPGVTPGLPFSGNFRGDGGSLTACCPTKALKEDLNGRIRVDYGRCVHCYRCLRGTEEPLDWESTYEWASLVENRDHSRGEFGAPFMRSTHIIVVDAGDCGACLNEVKQLGNPYYNLHRLGFFITPTPRHADVLMVVGAVTDPMRFVLQKVYDAMPTPKRVIAVGACAISGGVFAGSINCSAGLAEVLPVDVEVPGNPPPPLAILHGLLLTVGRKPASPDAPPTGRVHLVSQQ